MVAKAGTSRGTHHQDRAPIDWRYQAACRGKDTLFFAPEGERAPDRMIREAKAKALCSDCWVRTDCLLYALSSPEKHGTWGGLNEEERQAKKRNQQRQALRERAAEVTS